MIGGRLVSFPLVLHIRKVFNAHLVKIQVRGHMSILTGIIKFIISVGLIGTLTELIKDSFREIREFINKIKKRLK